MSSPNVLNLFCQELKGQITVSLLLSFNSAGLSNPLLSESFADTLTIATTKGMEAATEERLFGIVQQFSRA